MAEATGELAVEVEPEVYNILPLHDMLADNAAFCVPQVRAAMQALQAVSDLPMWRHGMDMLCWLGALFGFQKDNVKNQREHVVLLLANFQMRLQPPPEPKDLLDRRVVQYLHKRLLQNYSKWCFFLMEPNQLRLNVTDERHELLYCCLYLLIWGEAANLRFMPECLCFIFHHMAKELTDIVQGRLDQQGRRHCMPQSFGQNGFLAEIVKPIYEAIKGEAQSAKEGRAPHSSWRNYDDMNEFFWSRRCFKQLGWPLNKSSNYLVTPQQQSQQRRQPNQQRKVGKTGFVEQRSFINIYRSFDHLWTGLILMLQAMMILAFNGDGIPWHVLYNRDVQGCLLTIFVTWSGLRVLQAVLDAATQYSLISSDTILIGVRMVLKILVASGWTAVFSFLLAWVWVQRMVDRKWSQEANLRLFQFLETAAVYILPEILAIILFILPWIRNSVERAECRIFHAFTWWFQTRLFVARGLHRNFIDNIRYTTFWLVVLFAKFSFSYFFQVRPLVEPTRDLLRLNVVNFEWHEFFRNHNRFVVALIWAPVILIYLMDIQIWYAVFQSLVGAILGLSAHIGEIRRVQQLKLRFPFFASAIAFNLAPEEGLLEENVRPHSWLVAAIKDMVRRVKLRYGLGKDYRKFESNTLEARKFAYIWNKVMHFFREEDLLSDQELELLEIPGSSWNVSVFQWPSVLLSNEVLIALSITQYWHGYDDEWLWARICKSEYRRCAVVECYESFKHLLKLILREDSMELGIVEHVFQDIEDAIYQGTFCQRYKVSALAEVHAKVLGLVRVLPESPTKKEVVVALQNLYDVVIRDFPVSNQVECLRGAGLTTGHNELLFVYAVQIPHPEKDKAFYRRLRRLRTTLSTKEAMINVPKNLDAKRRIAFFSNSIFMNMPRAPSVERMLSFSVLTPYYAEDVLYTDSQLKYSNEDGVRILFYLQSIYPDEWKNFLERMHLQDIQHPEKVLVANEETAMQLRLWASYRGQTLGRTVRGMMYYHHALETLAYLDAASELDLKQDQNSIRLESLASRQTFDCSTSQRSMKSLSGMSAMSRASQEKATALLKFSYVVACQIYGTQKAERDPRADEILYLMKNNPAMRVAYIDEVNTPEGNKFFSVLVKYDTVHGQEVEIYRIELPGHVMLGEGKPENQNHALIFTRGDAVQTIDMNQDNYFEEALKIRNLLQEFTNCHGLRRPQLLGVREHVFTGSVSCLAWFMSAQESSFVTLGQRVLANPLKIRMHYGHADVLDRIWFLTRGGISKASKVINISEDIFAGFNCTLRGGNITHHEYIQLGKGRDVGLNQIALFEAKVSIGNGEQMLSRDVYRLGHRLDFFRMLSFYYTTVGFYVSSLITILTVYVFLWGRVYLGLSGIEKFIAKDLSNSALTVSLNQQFLFQLGAFAALPILVESSLEHGFSTALWEFLTMQLELFSVFFSFSLGIKTHYFGKTLFHGGAKYCATDHGLVFRHKTFAENYRLFARSHFVKGLELIILLIIYEAYGGLAKDTYVYMLLTCSSWFLALSWIMAPFLFNPSGFDWLQTVYDFEDFRNWIWYKGGVLTKANQSWEVWWNEGQDHLRTAGFWGKLLEVVLSLRFILIQYGMVYRLHIAANNKSIFIYLFSWIYIILAILICILVAHAGERYSAKNHLLYRAIQAFVTLAIAVVLVLLIELTNFQIVDLFLSLLAFIPSGWGLICISLVMKPFLVNTSVWAMVVTIARLYEFALGIIVMTPLAILSWLPGFQEMQTRILFNQGFSRGLHISRILAGKKAKPKI